jgi:hypothetical protein
MQCPQANLAHFRGANCFCSFSIHLSKFQPSLSSAHDAAGNYCVIAVLVFATNLLRKPGAAIGPALLLCATALLNDPLARQASAASTSAVRRLHPPLAARMRRSGATASSLASHGSTEAVYVGGVPRSAVCLAMTLLGLYITYKMRAVMRVSWAIVQAAAATGLHAALKPASMKARLTSARTEFASKWRSDCFV